MALPGSSRPLASPHAFLASLPPNPDADAAIPSSLANTASFPAGPVMAISFSCPCGKQSDLPESFLGKRVRCNFFGALSIVALQYQESAQHPELDWETHVAESLLTGPASVAGG